MLFLAVPAAAQQAGRALPGPAQPGRELPQQPLMPPSPGLSITVPEAPAVSVPQGAEAYTLTLSGVTIEDATAFPPEELQAYYQALLGKEVTVADLFKVAGEIELHYHEAGYVTSRVIVPQQKIEDGHFRIVVIEGFITDVVYANDVGPAKDTVDRLLSNLRNVVPISIQAIERSLLLANELPGMTVRGTLEPSPTVRGGSIVVVHSERKAFESSLTVDNRNTPFTAAWETVATQTANSFSSNADKLTLSAKAGAPFRREWYVTGDYQANLGSDGLVAGFTSSYAHSNPALNLSIFDVQSHVVSEALHVSYPIIRSRLQNLRFNGSFEYRNVTTMESGAPFSADRLRIFTAGVNYDLTDTWDGVTAVQLAYHQGVDLFGATPRGSQQSRADGRSVFGKETGAITRVQELPEQFSILATATAQYSPQVLLSSEELSLGGPNFGRAFDQGEILGDSGWAGLIELRYSPSIPEILPHGLQLFSYYDGGEVWTRNTPTQGGQALASAGAGARANVTDYLYTFFETDQPLTREVQSHSGKPLRLFLGATLRY